MKKTGSQQNLPQQVMKRIETSPTPFHCVATMGASLKEAGFQELDERDLWKLKPGQNYFLVKEGTIIAFRMPKKNPDQPLNFQIIGAHTDSPCLKLKPNPESLFKGYLNLGVEVYGGVLLSTWFDRELGIAGQVTYYGKDGKPRTSLININQALAIIPNLAIHLNRTVNEARSINPQLELPPLVSQGKEISIEGILQSFHPEMKKVLAYDLYFYDLQKPAFVGLQQEFIASARLDNQLSCFVGMQALLDVTNHETNFQMLICNDHEEVGSNSTTGAAGPMLKALLTRLTGSEQEFHRAMASSRLLSVDNAHGVHPNYRDKHEQNNGPVLGYGPAFKINANQRYASSNRGVGYLKDLAEKRAIPYQSFVSRSDMACGSTIGPITATLLGIEAIDIGVPTFAMHSIRELAGTHDVIHLYRMMSAFFES